MNLTQACAFFASSQNDMTHTHFTRHYVKVAHVDEFQSVMNSSEFRFSLIRFVWQSMHNQKINFDLGSSEHNFESGRESTHIPYSVRTPETSQSSD